ncbi:hypothetical protein DPEC_G00202570 [Dallia pectoralis]|uniref:Uncharacterized protein n=1 Tax=Dallia pectoralis TaxID=75939 RepID=A0ACC2G9B4_DALPE|nr:hypothetical protein DPEC_G00202570 [Dallia pectoralis]
MCFIKQNYSRQTPRPKLQSHRIKWFLEDSRLPGSVCQWSSGSEFSSVVQHPPVVEETVGNDISMDCVLQGLTSYCYTVAWLQLQRWPRTLQVTKNTNLKHKSGYPASEKICPMSINNATVSDTGIYYCVVVYNHQIYLGNGTTVIVKDGREETGLTETGWTHNSDSATEFTRNQILVQPEEWDRGAECTCVVEFDGQNINKTVQKQDVGDLCYITVWMYRLLGVTAWLLLLILSVIVAFCHRKPRSVAPHSKT